MIARYISKLPRWAKNKYAIATFVFLLFIIVLNDNNIFYQYKLYNEQKELEKTSAEWKSKIAVLKQTELELQKNPLIIEKIAREKYGLKKPNEVVFLFQ